MCTYVYATIDKGAATLDMRELLARHRRAMRVLNRPELASQIPDGQILLGTTDWHCDCHVPLGRPSQLETKERHDERLLKKRIRDGWSQARIDRWLAERRVAEAKQQRDEPPGTTIAEWMELVDGVLESGLTKQFGIMHYMHGDEPPDSQIKLTLHRVKRTQVDEAVLRTLPEFEVLLISR